MRGKKYQPHVLAILTLCVCLLLPLVTKADDQGETYIKCTEISTDGTLYIGNLELVGDRNCFSFNAKAGKNYVIETSELNIEFDTIIYLYNQDGAIEIDGDDNIGTSLASKIEWVASASEVYYVMVERLEGTTDNISYKISIR